MGLKMKNVDIMGYHQFLGEGDHTQNNTYGELPKKGGLDNLQRSGEKIGRRVFLRGADTSLHTMT